ncbi:MAG: hypothetical protein EAZ30_08965 [Betaproteobacteria bacterium]|nr:MAG: hypothetical protein EAZ30_08965 [Betaproteobacteria bacterium]
MPAKSPPPIDPTTQQDLFGNASPLEPSQRLALRAKVLARTPAQKRFSRLLTDIENANRRMQGVSEMLEAGRNAYRDHLEPIFEQLTEAQRAVAFQIAKRLVDKTKHKGFTVPLKRFTTDLLEGMLPPWEVQADDPLRPLYEEIFGPPEAFDETDEDYPLDPASREALRAMGIPEEFLDQLSSEQRGDADPAPHTPPPPGAQGKKRAPNKRELAAEQSAESAKLALRTLYRQLASSLHPDRARDDAARLLATERMARANVAYAANDLQALLALQIETARDTDACLVNETDATVVAWCEALKAQLVEIRSTTLQLERHLVGALGGPLMSGRVKAITVDFVLRSVKASAAEVKEDLALTLADVAELQDDTRFVAWLKDMQDKTRARSDPFFDDFDDIFDEALRAYGSAQAAPKRRAAKAKSSKTRKSKR